MVEDEKSEVVLDKVFSRIPQIHRIEIIKFPSQFFQNLFTQFGILANHYRVPSSGENVIEKFVSQFLWWNILLIYQFCKSVISHVNSRIAQSLDNPLPVPRKRCPETTFS